MSKIEVNTIEPQCGTTLTVGAVGTTVAVPSNVVKSNALQASDAGNIIKQCGTTVTIGASGDTIALASGASQTGFGRTGTVDWDTAIKTTGFTAVNGEGYFCNTSGGAFTAILPVSPSVGNVVSISDYAQNFGTAALTVGRNGSNIQGDASDLTMNVSGETITLIYADATKGWIITSTGKEGNVFSSNYIVATGGTPSQSGDYEIRTFTGPGTFDITCAASSTPANAIVDYMVVAGGGGSGGGGGGAGGFRESPGTATGSYSVSPLGAAPAAAITVSTQGYPIIVGAGGPPGCCSHNGSVSTFDSITSAGGGGGKGNAHPTNSGGSGGGGRGSYGGDTGPAGSGNTPPVSPPQGNPGGIGTGPDASNPSPPRKAGGGGGATAVGNAHNASPSGKGGDGATTSISGSPTAYAGGGGGNAGPAAPSPGGTGGGGPGGSNGTVNTGGGGGLSGGSGVVLIRYKFQN